MSSIGTATKVGTSTSLGSQGGRHASSLGEPNTALAHARGEHLQEIYKQIQEILDEMKHPEFNPQRTNEMLRRLDDLGDHGREIAKVIRDNREEFAKQPMERNNPEAIYNMLINAWSSKLGFTDEYDTPEQLAYDVAMQFLGQNYGFGWKDLENFKEHNPQLYNAMIGSNQEYSKGFKRAFEEILANKNPEHELAWTPDEFTRDQLANFAKIDATAEQRRQQTMDEINNGTATLDTYQQNRHFGGNDRKDDRENWSGVQRLWIEAIFPDANSQDIKEAIMNYSNVVDNIPGWLKTLCDKAISLTLSLFSAGAGDIEGIKGFIGLADRDPTKNPLNVFNVNTEGLANMTQALGQFLASLGGDPEAKRQAQIYLMRESLRQMRSVISPEKFYNLYHNVPIGQLKKMIPFIYANELTMDELDKISDSYTSYVKMIDPTGTAQATIDELEEMAKDAERQYVEKPIVESDLLEKAHELS